ncbi:MAG: polysaccharide deacetylase family protein [Bradyrhizobium sp.]|nr:polysaccharide deacetylase family protein [Bradyrhizobium sp.]
MDGHQQVRGLIGLAVAAPLIALFSSATPRPIDCPRAGTLGTSRVLKVDAVSFPQVGLKIFPQTLPLRDHEVVLTFDDGPWPPTTPKVLDALAKECVRATFFLIGKPALEHPSLVRRIAAAGHTVGHHSWTHFSLSRMPQSNAFHEIDDGIAAVEEALHGVATTTPTTPFFRFPGFEMTKATQDYLRSRGIVVFATDIWASDWKAMTPSYELKLLIRRLEVARKGIILLHDPQGHTAAMLPAFLRYLRDNHYHVVHVVPTGPAVDFDGAP